jgi:hypothetical protein
MSYSFLESRLKEFNSFRLKPIEDPSACSVLHRGIKKSKNSCPDTPFVRIFDHEKSTESVNKILKSLKQIRSLAQFTVPMLSDADLQREVIILAKKLHTWESMPGAKFMSAKQVLKNCLREGPEFAKYVSKVRFYSYKASVETCGYYLPDEFIFDEYTGYGSVFPESHLIHWRETSEDFFYSMLEDDVEDDALKEFEDELRELLLEINIRIYPLGDEEIKSSIFSTSQSFTTFEKEKSNSLPFIDALINFEQVDPGVMTAKRCVVQVGPANTRDGTMCFAPDRIKIKRVHHILLQILDHCKESAMLNSSRKAGRRISKLSRTRRKIFYHLDIRKCGLTMSKKIILRIVKVIKDLYPDLDDIDHLEEIVNSSVFYNGRYVIPKRGYRLGWANEVPTLVQIIIFRLWKKSIDSPRNVEGLFFNDDSVITHDVDDFVTTLRRDHELIALKVRQISDVTLASLTSFYARFCIMNKKKIFASYENNVFCEIYSGNLIDRSKLILAKASMLDLLACYNTFHAKCSINNVFENFDFPLEDLEEEYHTVVCFFGYEFRRDEHSIPQKCGGWLKGERGDVDASLAMLDSLEKDDARFWYNMYDALESIPYTTKYRIRKIPARVSKLTLQRKYEAAEHDCFEKNLSDAFQAAREEQSASKVPLAYTFVSKDEACDILRDQRIFSRYDGGFEPDSFD